MKFLISSTILACVILITQPVVLAKSAVEVMTEFYKVADARPFDSQKLKAFYSDNYIDHDNHSDKPSSGDKAVELFAMLASAAPDSVHEISFIEPVGENKALVRWRFKGTQTGALFGIPASGKKFDIAGMELWEIHDGKVVGIWHVEEILQLVEQLTKDDN